MSEDNATPPEGRDPGEQSQADWYTSTSRKGKWSGSWGRHAPEKFTGPDTLGITGDRDHKLGQWSATAICGNDISSSCLYVAGLATAYAGYLSPFALLIVAAVLFLFRYIYAEVGDALPLNGGAYNCLLNTTTKFKASIAACLTILSYVATAVISANAAMSYFQLLIDSGKFAETTAALEPVLHHPGGLIGYLNIDVLLEPVAKQHNWNLWTDMWALVGEAQPRHAELFSFVNVASGFVLLVFAVLAIVGITESAVVAVVIFFFHMSTLVIFCSVAMYAFVQNPEVLQTNWGVLPIDAVTGDPISFVKALFFGFAAALLGISGFESSANFIEEQKAGVFPKTLRNMWLVVSFFNPLTAFLALAILPSVVEPLRVLAAGGHDMPLLALIANKASGTWLVYLVCVDAVLVLCGAVLTSFVGVGGLVERMTLDRCLPQSLIKKNAWRGTNHRIYIAFFVICVSIIAATKGSIATLAGVYTISFLGVMGLFAIGNMLLKVKRSRLKRQFHAPWLFAIIALIATVIGVAGNIMIDPTNFEWFLIYFIPTLGVVGIMFLRIQIFSAFLGLVDGIMGSLNDWSSGVHKSVEKWIESINSQRIVFFSKGDNASNLNLAILYVLENEPTKRVTIVHLYPEEIGPDEDATQKLKHDIAFLDKVYPQVDIEVKIMPGRFTPETIDKLSAKLDVPKNYMFIGVPGADFPHNLGELGGVRLII